MAAVAERGVHGRLTWCRCQDGEDLGHHDGPMGARESLAARLDVPCVLGVFVGAVFLVLVLEPAWVGARVPGPTPMGRVLRDGVGRGRAG